MRALLIPSALQVKRAVFAAVAVLLLQPIFAFSTAFVRLHTDLASVRAHIVQGYRDGLVSADERPRSLIDRYGHQFTECTALLLSIDDEPNILRSALFPHLHSKFIAPCAELERSAAGVETAERTDYSRYWHGYRLYIWPLLDSFSLRTMRTLNALLLVAAGVLFFSGLRMAVGLSAAIIFSAVLFSLTDIWRMWNITPHALSTIIILAGTGLFARLHIKRRSPAFDMIFAAIFGAIFCFADFLINPPLAPMLLAFIVTAVQAQTTASLDKQRVLEILASAALIAASWFGGYALTWISKWVITVLFSGDGQATWQTISNQILLRLYGQEIDAVSYNIPLVPTLTVLIQSFLSVGSIVVALIAAAIGLQVWKNRTSFDLVRFFLLSSPTLIAVLWFELLSNHTQTHVHFTYRSESAAIAIVLTAALMTSASRITVGELMRELRKAV